MHYDNLKPFFVFGFFLPVFKYVLNRKRLLPNAESGPDELICLFIRYS